MSSFSEKGPAGAEFIFVGDHPALDFVNTLALAQGRAVDHLQAWSDVVAWFSLAGLAKDGRLQVPASRGAAALGHLVELRREWKAELERLVAGARLSDGFLKQLNRLLADDLSHEVLHGGGKAGFRLDRAPSSLTGEKLALALMAGRIAHFLAEANLEHLRRCANTTSCVLFFYDTTKNHRRQWCSTAACGNRHKVAAFRKRQSKKK